MSKLIISDQDLSWMKDQEGIELISPDEYIARESYQDTRGIRLVNLCKEYSYQSMGYYVSLLAEARRHKVIPSIQTIQDLRFSTLLREGSQDFDELIQQVCNGLNEDKIEIAVYFGKSPVDGFQKLARELFALLQCPCLKATFSKKQKWQLQSIKSLSIQDVSVEDRSFLLKALENYLLGKKFAAKSGEKKKYDLAILVNPDEENPPSNDEALKRFAKAADKLGFDTEFITKADFGKLIQFDALFIRETTFVNHHTFRFAKKAHSEGLVVIDDPDSILRCTNKVYLSELLNTNKIPSPKSLILKKGSEIKTLLESMNFPFILKQPDGAFSKGVKKVQNEKELKKELREFFKNSDLIIAQEYLPTDFDWRIGVLDGQILYACKYFMASGHWQIVNYDGEETEKDGLSEAIEVSKLPRKLQNMALKATKLIGKGLYGVDIKESQGKYFVIEINDNPSIDAGIEDDFLKDQLYDRIMEVFLQRIKSYHANDKN